MDINVKEIDDYVSKIYEDNKMIKVNNLYLSKSQIEILDKYKINYKNVKNVRELIFTIEEYLNDSYFEDLYDLEDLSMKLAEFNYYHDTNK